MHREPSLAYLVADAGRAKILLRHGAGWYTELMACEAPPRQRVRRDTRGRVFAGPGPSRSAVPEAQPETAANAFAAELAERLEGFVQRRAFDRLMLVAPARTLARLRPRLQAAAKAVVGEHAKDLTKLPVSTLLKALDALSLVPQAGRG